MALTNIACEKAKSKEKDYKLFDEKGLFLQVSKSGGKYWRFKYRFAKKEKVLAFGVYPEVSLKEAREKRDVARKHIANSTDPGLLKKQKKLTLLQANENSFEALASEWFERESESWSPAHIKKQKGLLTNNLIPYLGPFPVKEITPMLLLNCLRKIENRGALETARRTKQVAGQIMRYAVVTGRAERDPTPDLKGALKTPQVKHYAAITEPRALGRLLLAMDSFDGTIIVGTALKLAPLFFVRPGVLRKMEWDELDLIEKEWRIPANKMKMKQPHIVPLSSQAIELLVELQPLTGRWQYVFPSERTRLKPMSDNALNAALRRMGYSREEITIHGFRATARTLLDEELEYEPHIVEHQLAHEVKDGLGRAYNRTKHLPHRKKMMQEWGDYLYELKRRSSNVAINE